MKRAVEVTVASCQLDPDGEAVRTENRYHGTWYRQGDAEYLVYQDSEVRTTLRWDPHEWRLFRRGPDLEGWQVFRTGARLESDLRVGGSLMPLATETHAQRVTELSDGCQLLLEYDLYAEDDLLGRFSLLIHLHVESEPAHDPA